MDNKSPSKAKRYSTLADDHLTYDQMVHKREQEDEGRHLVILKQVIKENVKRRN